MHYKLFVKTYGCQMNMYDSIKMQDLLAPHGFENTEEIAEANLVILNTCHIREKASEKVFSELGRIKKLKNKAMAAGRDYYICVAGCVAQAEGEEIFRRAPYVDIVVGPQSYQNLPILIEKVKRQEKWVLDLDFQEDEKFDKLPEESAPQGAAAFLTVQEGCDKFCHFCCVPYTRGQEYSRTPEEVIREAMKIAAQGTCEITLLGQNVTAYSRKDEQGREWNLPQLIEAIAGIAGIKRIRYTTSHPIDMTDELIEAHRTIPKLMPYLHLPVQSGSDRILKAMNRNHSRDLYFEIIKKFEAAIPNMAFSSDFIVGYPGETEKDFEDTMDLVERINYGECYSFKYSPRPGTPAASLANTVDEETKSRRLKALQDLIVKKQSAFNHSKVGEVLEVLVDGVGKHQGQMVGKSPYMQTVNINDCPSSRMGKVVLVKITSASRFTLSGELCNKDGYNAII